MVEKKEFAIIFENELNDDNTKTFIPVRVVEGKYDSEYSWFLDTEEKLTYIHIEEAPEYVLGFANRVIINFDKYSISKEKIEKIKKEILENAKEYIYKTNPINPECVIATHKVTGDEYLVDNYEDEITEKDNKIQKNSTELTMTPLEIESKIKETIKGQDEAVRKIVTALWTTIKFRNMRKKNMLIVGPTGVGKTAIFEKIKKILNLPVVIFSVPGLSQAGYTGRSTDEILKQVYYDALEDIDEAEKTIVILDEIDKIAYQKGGTDVSTSGVQNELLKIIEGCNRYIETSGEPGFEIDTSNMIFVATGAFQELYEEKKKPIGFSQGETSENKKTEITTEKLIEYGLKRELVGRLPILIELNNLGKPELKDIIVNSDESELIATANALKELGIEIENLDETIDYIVEDSIKNKIGARGLILTINNLFQEIFYEVGNNPNKYSKVILGPNIIKDKNDFKLIKKKTYTKKRVNTQKG